MTAPQFQAFGIQHLVATVATFAIIGIIVYWIQRMLKDGKSSASRLLAVLLVLYRSIETLWRWRMGESWPELLPLHLCGMSVLLTAIVLWFESDRVFQITYFWVASGATMSLHTPDLQFGFPNLAFFSFFIGHGLPILGIAVAVFVLGMRPRAKSILRALIATWGMGAIAAPVNLAYNTNYLFLSQKPLGATPFDYFGPWPWYLIVVNFVGLLLFSICYLPFSSRFKQLLPSKALPVGTSR